MQEQRVHQRKLMGETATLGDADGNARHPVVMLDVSRLGVSFINHDALAQGSSHFLDFHLPGSALSLEAVIQVVHSTSEGMASGHRIGARFVYVGAETSAAIGAYVAA
jgi:hypothetical protein